MYTQNDLKDLDQQYRQRLLMTLLPAVLLMVPLVWSLTVRAQWLTVLSTVLLGSILIFLWGTYLSPVSAYRKHIRGLLAGRQRELEGIFKGYADEVALRDKVRFRPLMVNVGDAAEPKDDRLLYWDINLPLPDWQEGERLNIASFDKAITRWERV